MVLRKPYAFLIKNFKLIHIILTILMCLFFSRMRDVTNFLKEYIAEGSYTQMSNVVSEYIGTLGLLLPLIIIAVCILISYILRMKDKPIKFYLLTILTHIIELIVMIIGFVVLSTIQQGTATVNIIQIFTDFIDAISYLIIPFIVVSLVRSVGFNIKQFNFKKDLMELNIAEEDSEEFELEVEVDTEDIKAKFNRKLRFFKYVYLENKPVFIGLIVIAILGICFGVYSYISGIEKIYEEGYTFVSYGATVTVKNSYKTQASCDGNTIRNDKFYVIVELDVKNPYDSNLTLPYENIYLRVTEEKKYPPTDRYKDEFSDFGLRYTADDKLESLEQRQVILIYEVDAEYIDNPLRFEYIISTENEDKTSASYKYVKIDLTTDNLSEIKLIEEKKLSETLDFKDSLISGTKIKINEVDFNSKYTYKYTQLIGNQEREFTKMLIPTDISSYKKSLMRLKVDLTKNDNLNKRIYNSLFEKFASVEYEVNGKMVKQKPQIIDLTPSNNEYTYLEVVQEVSTSPKVVLVFTIRDKEYRYTVVDKESENKETENMDKKKE